jgi:diguanylate cyclase (GGDEF)-like protein
MVMPVLGRTLTHKFTLLLLGFLLLQVIQLVAGVYGIRYLGNEGAYVNEAGKQRARTLMLASLARQAVSAGSQDNTHQILFRTALADYDTYFSRLTSFAEGLPTRSALLDGYVAEARDTWTRDMRPLIVDLDFTQATSVRNRLARYEALSLAQIERLDRIVGIIEGDIQANTRRLIIFQAVIVSLSLLLGIIGIVMARQIVTRPLRRLIEVARSIASGAYHQRVSAVSDDEIGELADSFNRMAASIGEKTSRIEALNDIAVQITSVRSLQELLEEIMQRGIQLSSTQAACIAFYDEERARFEHWITRGLSDHFVKNLSFRSGGLADQAFASGKYVLSDDRLETPHKLSSLSRTEGIRAFICLPLTSHASRLGVIYFYRKDRDFFLPDEIDIFNTFAHLAAGAIESARLQEQTHVLAVTDKLTGLRNRRLFDERIEEEIARAHRNNKPLSLLMLDIDDFKKINDTHGHVAGDSVLQFLGHSLSEHLWRTDFAARYGGEEFAVILPETDWNGARRVAERIRNYVANKTVTLPHGHEISLTLSAGVSSFPACGDSAERLIEHADQALYTAKREGKNRVCLYSEILKAQLEKMPRRIIDLLNQDLENVEPIVTAVSVKANFYHHHTDVVEQSAMQLADALKLAPEDREALRLASRLHDIGMIVIPDELLSKRSPLTPQEWASIRQHPVIGAGFLEQVPALRHIAPIVRHHHERYDGAGYPDGLKGSATPYLARVLAVADAYGSMVTDWPGHIAVSPADAQKHMAANVGTQFDPGIVMEFMAYYQRAKSSAA